MRKFSSYGPVNTKLHYYVPRAQLIDRACEQLIGQDPQEGGQVRPRVYRRPWETDFGDRGRFRAESP